MKNLKLVLLTLFILPLSCSDYQSEIQAPDAHSKGGFTTDGATAKNPFTADMLHPNDKPFSEKQMLLNIGANIIAKNVHEFELQAELLANRTENYCSDLDDGSDAAASQKALKDQWKAAMLAFHAADVAPVGPASDNNRRLSDGIYAWPLISPCSIDDAVAIGAASGTYSETDLVNVKGLGAMEYLLFEPTLVPKCKAFANKNAVEWGKKPLDVKRKDRCHYARFLTKDIVAKARELDNAWDVDKGNFTKTLVDGSRYGSVREAVNDLTDSLFSLAKIKDEELSKPMGFTADCKAADKRCPELAEHAWSGLAIEALQIQMISLRNIFRGSVDAQKGYGFDDYLASQGHAEIGVQFLDNIGKAITDSSALTATTLQTQIASFDVASCQTAIQSGAAIPSPSLCSFYADVRAANLLFTNDMMIALALSAPTGFQGDND